MSKVYISFISTLVFSLLTFNAVGQGKMLKGFVTTFDSIPLNNVEIIVSSSNLTVFTDSIGEFEFKCLPKDKIKVSAKGFSSKKIKIKIEDENKILHVNLDIKSGSKNREIAVGYGHVKDDEKLSAMANLNNDDVDFSNFTNIYELIERTSVVVQIINKEIIIRGANSVNGTTPALIIIDGVPSNGRALDNLNPGNVKSINVLKGVAASVYGSRGAGGAVVIETKSGKD